MPKYVFSSTLRDPAWTGTTVVGGAVADGVRRLGGDLIVYGFGRFGQTLCDAGLVDTLTLSLIPVFVAEAPRCSGPARRPPSGS
jgi:dihydrofolate reductase